MENHIHEVNFGYCEYCENKTIAESEDPCWDCLNEPLNEDSRKPIFYEPQDKYKDILL